jgi:hypothetical protein
MYRRLVVARTIISLAKTTPSIVVYSSSFYNKENKLPLYESIRIEIQTLHAVSRPATILEQHLARLLMYYLIMAYST